MIESLKEFFGYDVPLGVCIIVALGAYHYLLRVIHWYFLACITISTLRTHDNIDIIKKDSIDFEEGAISKSDLKGNYCFA